MRYLKYFGDVNVDEIKDIGTFKKVYFAEGFDGETAGFTVSAILKSILSDIGKKLIGMIQDFFFVVKVL